MEVLREVVFVEVNLGLRVRFENVIIIPHIEVLSVY
jgi:hypothetical protein